MTNGKRSLELMGKMNYIRLGGHPEEYKAMQTLAEELKSFGLDSTEDPFKIEGSDIKTAKLSANGTEYTVHGMGMSGCTPEGGLEAPFLYAEDGNDVMLAKAKGKIILLNSRVSAPQYEKLIKAGVVGFIVSSGTILDELDKTDLEHGTLRTDRHLQGGKLPKIPGVLVRAKDAVKIIESKPETVKITLIQEEVERTSHNLIADIKGTEFPDEYIVFTAHYDSVVYSHGMFDNLAGSVAIMEAARYFKANPPKRSMRFIFCGSEELGLLGSLHYAKTNGEWLTEHAKLIINVDVGGQILGANNVGCTSDMDLVHMVNYIVHEVGFSCNVNQGIASSDSAPFADILGIPGVNISRGGVGIHCRHDVIDHMSPEALQIQSDFVVQLASKFANMSILPISKGIPQKLKDQFEFYFNRKMPGKSFERPARR